MAYLSVGAPHETELIVEKSRFLTYCAHVEGEQAARQFLEDVRARHPLATHVCFAYVADKLGNEQRFSDDGEPQGTAGMPILNVLKGQKLFETAVAVVRYFGGIKLGAGGLTRTYSAAAAGCVSGAQKCLYDLCAELTVAVDYPQADACMRFLGESGCNVLSRNFSEKACFTVAVRAEEKEGFCVRLKDRLNGRVSIEEGACYFAPFSINIE